MEFENILDVKDRRAFRQWLEKHHEDERECWVEVKRGRPGDTDRLCYLDAVEEALCFGWIDSTHRLIDGIRMQRFTPRKKYGCWSELNKERVRRLERLGLMTDAGRRVRPPMGKRSFSFDEDIVAALKKARVWKKFRSFPELYQRIRAGNLAFYKKRDPRLYERMLKHLIDETKKGSLYGEWNDYGRLSEE